MTSLKRSMAKGAAWMVLFKLVDRSLGLIGTLVLARLLVPADFGIVAMAASLVALLDLLGAFGLDIVLIQRRAPSREHYDTAWTLNILSGALIALLMILFSWPFSVYYREPRLVAVVCVLALNSCIQGFENIGIVAFRKELDFRKEFIFQVAKRLCGLAATIPLAFLLRSYWAMILGSLIGRITGVTLSFLLHPFRPRFALTSVRDFVHFSKWLFTQNLLNFLKDRSADFVIGRLAGAHALGVFNVSTDIASIPGNELVAPINRALLPAYAKLSHDKTSLQAEYLSVMGMVTLIAAPAVTGIAAVSPFLVPVLLGAKWHEAVSILSVLAFYGIYQVLTSNAYSALLAVGKPETFVKITATYVAVHVPLLIVLTRTMGLAGAAWAYVGATCVMLPVGFALITKALDVPVAHLVRQAWRPLVSSAVMYAVVKATTPAIDTATLSTATALHGLAVFVPLGAAVYVICLSGLWLAAGKPDGVETLLLRALRDRWRRVLVALGITNRQQ